MKKLIIICITVFLFASCATKNQGINMPVCLTAKIDSMKMDPKINLPESVTHYTYKGRSVYYVVSGCCDQFNEVYDENCKSIGAPDGGITGKGDNRLPDFYSQVTDKRVVWQNK